MKKLLLLLTLLANITLLFSQSPYYINYQTVIRNGEGVLQTNKEINFRFYIKQGSPEGAIVYSETQLVESNAYGICNLKIGEGIEATGALSDIDWGLGSHFLSIALDTDGLTNFIDVGATELVTVPYALYARNAGEIDKDVLHFPESDTLFAVRDHDGKIVFAVFPDGARVYVNEGVKGRIGGFAVTGRNPGKAAIEEDYMVVTADSTRVWVNEQVKGRVGGFAVTGRNPDKGMSGDYFVINSDSARIYINDTTTSKGRIGGFAVTGRNPDKGPNDDYLKVTRDSTRVYFNESGTKGRIGGFAVTGRNPDKGDGANDYFNISGNTTAEVVDSASKIMWYPQKRALLAGNIHVGSADSVGTNSTALGYRSIAMGEQSQAFGYQSQALGNYSTAIGKNAIADTTNSFAFGDNAKALNIDSYSIGGGAISSGIGSYAFGSVERDTSDFSQGSNFTEASGDYSFAIGMGSRAVGKGSTSIGLGAYSSGKNSIAMGTQAEATGDYSAAIGLENKASGYASVALGKRNEATGYISFVAGAANNASGPYSAAFGYTSSASGWYSFAAGEGSKANAGSAVALGYKNTAGEKGFAAGMRSTGGYGSAAIGVDVVAGGYSIALGHAITCMPPENDYYSVAIGLGTSNATLTQGSTMAIMGGNVGIGTVSPNKTLDVVGTAEFNGNTEINGQLSVNSNALGAYDLWIQGGPFNGSTPRHLALLGDRDGEVLYINWHSAYTNRTQLDGNFLVTGDFHVNGNITYDGTHPIGFPDYVFESDYKLESIEEHAEFMWREKHLPAVKSAKEIESEGKVDINERREQLLEELEKAHIYIERLNNELKTVKEVYKSDKENLEQRVQKLEEALNILLENK